MLVEIPAAGKTRKQGNTMAAKLVWMDLEMTGLNPVHDRIIEMATIITNDQLEILAEGPVLAVLQPESLLAGMDDWNQRHHSESGLLDRVRKEGISPEQAQAETLAFLELHTSKGASPLCGNSIWQDRRFLAGEMPLLESFLHYRIIDVSSIKELALRWRPDIAAGVKKQNQHLALADIRESIEELRYYREHFFQLSSG